MFLPYYEMTFDNSAGSTLAVITPIIIFQNFNPESGQVFSDHQSVGVFVRLTQEVTLLVSADLKPAG